MINRYFLLKKSGTIAVIGPLGDSKPDMIGTWAFVGGQDKVSTVVDGMKNIGGSSVNVLYAKGSELTDNPVIAEKQCSFPDARTEKAEHNQSSSEQLLKEALRLQLQRLMLLLQFLENLQPGRVKHQA